MNRRRRLCSIGGALWLFAAASGAAPSDEGDEQALLADADYAAGLSALKASDPASALRRFQAALKRFPETAVVHNELGYTYRKLGTLDRPSFTTNVRWRSTRATAAPTNTSERLI